MILFKIITSASGEGVLTVIVVGAVREPPNLKSEESQS
jgi:hypothetical protein